MAINFPSSALHFAGLKVPGSQIMYCISQDNGTPTNVVQWSGGPPLIGAANQEIYSENHQRKQSTVDSSTNPSTITVGAGNQVATIQLPQLQHFQTNPAIYTNPSNYYGQIPSQVYAISSDAQKDKIESHSSITSNDQTRLFKCANVHCDKAFRQRSTLIQHERIHLDTRPFQCLYSGCTKAFRQQSHLVQHSRIHIDSKPFACSYPDCGKTFRQRTILNQHNRIHCDASSHLLYKGLGTNGTLWPQNLPYPPDEIQSKDIIAKETFPPFTHSVFGNLTEPEFNKSPSKVTHEIPQKSSMPLYVRCPICQQEYKQKSTLLQHGCIHIESRPYPCLYYDCGRRFRQQSHLVQHIRIHKNEKPYNCPYQDCGKSFRQRTILNQHVRIHTNSKPYRCSVCLKDFRQAAILSQHEKTHLAHKPFSCPLSNCKRRFATESDLKKHIENHMHNTKPRKQSGRTSQAGHAIKPEVLFAQGYATNVHFNAQSFMNHQINHNSHIITT